MIDMQTYIFNQPHQTSWCENNGGIPQRPDPIPKYILADVNSKSQGYFGNTHHDPQYVYEIHGTNILTANYGFMEIRNGLIHACIRQFDTEQEAKDWVESYGLVFEHTGLVICQD